MRPPPASFDEFWPFYLGEHSRRATRRLHFLGTTLALAALGMAAAASPWWLLAALLGGYAPAWAGHFFFEKNRPATFTHPWWSLRGDFRMYRLMWTGRLGPELERCAAQSR